MQNRFGFKDLILFLLVGGLIVLVLLGMKQYDRQWEIVQQTRDKVSEQTRQLDSMRWLDALLIGLAQVVALVPGVSRSGSTITAGRGLKLDRQSAAVFSFLMSMPIIGAAVVLKGREVLQHGGITAEIVAGVLAAAISSWFAIAILLRYVSRHSYGIFALYRVILGVAVLVFLQMRG